MSSSPDVLVTTRRCVAWPPRAIRGSLRINRIILVVAHWCMRATDCGRGARPRICFDFLLMRNAGCKCPPGSALVLHLASPSYLCRKCPPSRSGNEQPSPFLHYSMTLLPTRLLSFSSPPPPRHTYFPRFRLTPSTFLTYTLTHFPTLRSAGGGTARVVMVSVY